MRGSTCVYTTQKQNEHSIVDDAVGSSASLVYAAQSLPYLFCMGALFRANIITKSSMASVLSHFYNLKHVHHVYFLVTHM